MLTSKKLNIKHIFYQSVFKTRGQNSPKMLAHCVQRKICKIKEKKKWRKEDGWTIYTSYLIEDGAKTKYWMLKLENRDIL